jgi:HEAT repeat protein
VPQEDNAFGHDTASLPLDAALVGASAHEPPRGAPDESLVLVDALSVAWATFTLYENPRNMEAFARAVETLAGAPTYPWRVEVGAEGFSSQGHPVASRREAARRLSRQIFSHGSAAIEITSPPTTDDLLGLFGVLAEDSDAGDATERLFAAGITSIALLPRELLLREAEEAADTAEVTAWCTHYDGDAEPFVHGLLGENPDDPAGLAERFVNEYQRVYGLLSKDDHWGREEVVHTFVDALSFVPRGHQAAVLDRLLAGQDDEACLVFLDQMGGEELGNLARLLTPAAHPLLVEYARIAAEAGERRHSELLRLLAIAEHTRPVGQIVADQVDAALRSDGGGVTDASRSALDRLRAGRPAAEDHSASGIQVLRGLMDLAKTENMSRIAEIWAAKAAGAIRDDRLGDADRWLTAVGGIGLGPPEQQILLRALAAEVDPPLVERVAALMADRDASAHGSALLRAAPLFLVDGLIEQLADTEEAGQRRRLVETLVTLAAHRPDALVPHLDDPRWFVVRNVVLALGRAHRPELADRIRRMADHEDHRVRREVLRSLARLGGGLGADELIAALADPHPNVRAEAAAQLGRSHDRSVDQTLIEELRTARSRDVKLAVVAALGQRTTPAAHRTMRGLANRRFCFGSESRALRRAARDALGGEAP